jgi:OOP family OmpA-OmpF porin
MKKIVIVALLSTFVATPALADNTGKYYVAGDFGKMTYSNTNPGGSDFSNPNAIRISGGYHFSPIFAVEGGYAVIGDSTLNSASGSATLKNSAIQVAAVGTYPVNTAFDLFGKLGLSFNSIKASGTGSLSGLNVSNSISFRSMIGIGVQYNVNQQFGIRAQYEKFAKFTMSNNSNQSWNVGESLSSLGVVYNF